MTQEARAQPPVQKACYDARSALTMFNRAARTAGRKPPTTPITTAKIRARVTTPGDKANPKPISEKLPKLRVETRAKESSDASPTPAAPPAIASSTDSTRTPEGLHQLVRVPPDLGVEPRAAGVGDPHHGPAVPAEQQLGAYRDALEPLRDVLAHDDLVSAELECPTLRDAEAGPQLERLRR